MATGSDMSQLKENLAQYEAQLHQVEAALTNDPENAELLKLKSDLNDVIKLTKDLMELTPQQRRKKSLAFEWKTGDLCKAIWSDNGKHYNAVIDMISDDGQTCTVTFDGYGTTEIVRVDELMSRDWEPPSLTVEKHKAKSSRQHKEELREIKKKKAQKKLARSQEVEQHRETEKQRWKNFTTKSARQRGGPINSKQKKSIFAVPDSIEGRVGIGTCNIGGKGMTGYEQPKSYLH